MNKPKRKSKKKQILLIYSNKKRSEFEFYINKKFL